MLLSTLRAWLLLLLVLTSERLAHAQQVEAGSYHTLSLHVDGSLWAWGYNANGQLGLGTTTSQLAPTQVGTGTTWAGVSAGQICSLAIRTDGTLWAWGDNQNGQLGVSGSSSQLVPVQVGTATNWRSVSVGYYHVLALKTDGTLWAWGSNLQGQLGTGGSLSAPQLTPQQVGTATTWASISAGENHSLAIRQDGTLWSWGNDSYGQLGQGGGSQFGSYTPYKVGTDTDWRSVDAGAAHSLALKTTGTLWGWGNNTNGQVGTGGTGNNLLVPTQIGTTTTWRSISAGRFHSVAIRQDGTLWAWGNNYYGQLGDGTTTAQATPHQAGTLTSWQSASAGINHTAALRTDNTCWAWGSNAVNQLGPTGGLQLTPVQIVPPTTWREVATGTSYTLAIRSDDTLWGWGYNADGELGLGHTTNQITPQQVGTATTWASVSAAVYHAVAVRTDGTLWAWGFNGNGRLGVGNTTNQLAPVQVGTDTNWQSVSAAGGRTMAIRTDGTLWAWGNNGIGVLGLGQAYTNCLSPIQVGTATNWTSVSASEYHTLAVRADGSLWAWGWNYYGQLGTGGSNSSEYLPVQVGTGGQWQSAVAGYEHSLAIRTDGSLWAWGYNGNGALGLGTTTDQPLPTRVGAASWQRLGAGTEYSAAIRTDGSLWAWGGNVLGQLGTGTTASQLSPTAVVPGWQWQRIALSTQGHTAAIRQDGTLWMWGYNDQGQLAQPYTNPLPLYVANGGAPLAVGSPFAAPAWLLAPNPAHEQTQLLGLPAGPLAVQVFDGQGRLVRTSTSTTLSTAGLVPGLYLVRAACAGQPVQVLRLAIE